MFNCRLVWRSLSLVEKNPFFCKCPSARKSNFIKTFNTENKYLFGGLIENQKQRRKRLNSDNDVLSGLENKETVETKSNTSQLVPGEKIKIPKRKRTIKTTESAENTDQTPLPESKDSNESLSAGIPTTEKLPSAKRSSSTKLKNDKPISKEIKEKSQKSIANIDEFTFQSLVPINEENYPLINSNKLELSSNFSLENVLCLGLSDSVVKEYIKYPSVSKIMEETMSVKSRYILKRWRQKKIEELGEEGFSKHLAGLKQRGQEFHEAVRSHVLGKPQDSVGEVSANALKSLAWLLQHISNPVAVESVTAHPGLEYKGIPDCVAMFKDIPVLIDWKLSDKPKKDLKDTYEAPVQISAYIGALNHDPNYKWNINHGLVAVAYASGDPCDVFLLAPKHCQIYWRHWLLRFDKFKARSHLHLDHDIDEKELQSI